jgi:RNA polymerase sigma-70 factor (ECF subfamily)
LKINKTICVALRQNRYMENEQFVINQAKSGNVKAFQQLVETYSNKLYSAAYRILGNKELAEDCVQEVFIKIYKKITSFNEQSKFSTWLYSITVNTAIDIQRKQAKLKNNQSDDFETHEHQSSGPEKSVWLDNISAATQSALLQLNEDVRLAFILRHHEERSINEICQILDLNSNTVKSRIFRAVTKLREILDPKVGDYETVD